MLSLLHLSFFSFLALLVMLMYRFRSSLPLPQSLRSFISSRSASPYPYAPLSTFSEQAAAGATSANFDIEADNIREGDSRIGLDEQGTRDVMDIMRRESVNFDQARLIRHNRYLAANGIDPSGMPLDAKAITRL